jgi:WD40 repeat protein
VIASGGDDHAVCLWDTYTGQLFTKLDGHHAAIVGVEFSSDGSMLMSSDRDGVTLTWDLVPVLEEGEAVDKAKCLLQ